jgi:hypothetical protein
VEQKVEREANSEGHEGVDQRILGGDLVEEVDEEAQSPH